MKVKPVIWMWAAAGLLVAGVLVTIQDYRLWRKEETQQYGQGWSDMDKPAMELGKSYLNREIGIRLMLPEEWKVHDQAKTGFKTAGGVEFAVAATLGEYMELRTGESADNLTDLTDRRAAEIGAAGGEMSEREYAGIRQGELTILEWREELAGGGAVIRQEAWGKHGAVVIIIAAEVPESDWPDIKRTVREIYRGAEWVL